MTGPDARDEVASGEKNRNAKQGRKRQILFEL